MKAFDLFDPRDSESFDLAAVQVAMRDLLLVPCSPAEDVKVPSGSDAEVPGSIDLGALEVDKQSGYSHAEVEGEGHASGTRREDEHIGA